MKQRRPADEIAVLPAIECLHILSPLPAPHEPTRRGRRVGERGRLHYAPDWVSGPAGTVDIRLIGHYSADPGNIDGLRARALVHLPPHCGKHLLLVLQELPRVVQAGASRIGQPQRPNRWPAQPRLVARDRHARLPAYRLPERLHVALAAEAPLEHLIVEHTRDV